MFQLLADYICLTLSNKLLHQDNVYIALPGGRSVVGLVPVLLNCLKESNVDLSRIHCYLSDERISTDDSDLNASLLNSLLGESLNQQFVTPETLNTCNEYFSDNNIVFDLVILGVGEDGHIASIFPDQEQALISDHTYLTIQNSPKPPSQRITLSKKSLLESQRLILLFIGESKKFALQNFYNNTIDSNQCPAKLALEKQSDMVVVSDIMI